MKCGESLNVGMPDLEPPLHPTGDGSVGWVLAAQLDSSLFFIMWNLVFWFWFWFLGWIGENVCEVLFFLGGGEGKSSRYMVHIACGGVSMVLKG